jgi:hypothetical protein
VQWIWFCYIKPILCWFQEMCLSFILVLRHSLVVRVPSTLIPKLFSFPLKCVAPTTTTRKSLLDDHQKIPKIYLEDSNKISHLLKFCWFGHCTIRINKKIGSKLLVLTKSYKISEIGHYSAPINIELLIFYWFGHDFLVVLPSDFSSKCQSSMGEFTVRILLLGV